LVVLVGQGNRAGSLGREPASQLQQLWLKRKMPTRWYLKRLMLASKISEPVVIPQSLIDLLKQFKRPHLLKVEKPIHGDQHSGKAAFEHEWQKNLYFPDDPSLQEWLESGGNYGFAAIGDGLTITDTDREDVTQKMKTINTFAVMSGGGPQKRHSYSLSNVTENGSINDPEEPDPIKRNIGNIQVKDKFCVAPGSKHFSGNIYKIVNNSPLTFITKEDFEELFGDRLTWAHQRKREIQEDAEKENKEADFTVPLEKTIDMSKMNSLGHGEYQGPHPIHGSVGGKNFDINTDLNYWHCFRCNSGGGWAKWLAVKYGVIKCIEAQPGIPLTPIQKREVLQKAKEDGFDVRVPDEEMDPDVGKFFEKMRNGVMKFIPAYLAKEIMSETHLFTRASDEAIFRYNSKAGIYEEVFDIIIGQKIAEKLGKHYSRNREQETISYIKRKTVKEVPPLTEELIAVKNGILNIYTKELKPFSPDFIVFNAFSETYNPEIDCPENKKFMSQVLHEKDILMLQEFLGHCLEQTCQYDKALMLIGATSTGKTTFLEVWKAFLGKKNIAAISLQELATDKYALADLYAKVANIYDDLPNIALKDISIFLQLVTGATLSAQHKYKDRFNFENRAKLVFATNEPPKPPEDADAYFRRWLMGTFPFQFTNDSVPKKDPNIIKKLITEDELTGLLNWALEGLERLTKRGDFTASKTIEEAREQYMLMCDPLAAFVSRRLTLISFNDKVKEIDKEETYLKFLEFCRQSNLPPVSKWILSSRLPTLIPCQGTRYKWDGIRFKTEEEIQEEE
jgi:P4 family phage/plasmid primase-like protien